LKRYIKQKIKNFVTIVLNEQNQNIKSELIKRALSTTVDYIEEKMTNVSSVDTKFKVHDKAIKETSISNGLILEFGVYSGETINYIARKLPNHKIFGFDSFEGLPEFWRAGFDKGKFSVKQMPEVQGNVQLMKGWFDATLPDFVKNNREEIAYLHIDCDLYSSTKTIFDLLSKQIVKGTIIVFDEYFNYPGWEDGEFKAFQEFIKETKKEYKYLTYNYLHEQVAVAITKG
jgi:hypothetical protein